MLSSSLDCISVMANGSNSKSNFLKLLERTISALSRFLPGRPKQQSIESAFSKAQKLRVIEQIPRGTAQSESKVRLEIYGDDLATIRDFLRIDEFRVKPFCLCGGDFTLQLIDAEGHVIKELGYHLGYSISHPDWSFEGVLVDGTALAKWLSAKGIKPTPREVPPEVLAAIEREHTEVDPNLWTEKPGV